MSTNIIQDRLLTSSSYLVFQSWGPGNEKLKILLSQLDDKALESLNHLKVARCNVSIVDIESLAYYLNFSKMKEMEGQGLSCLKILSLSEIDLGNEGVAILVTGLDDNDVLEDLDLSRNVISDVGVIELMRTCYLAYLDLSVNQIGDEGAVAIARRLRRNNRLKSIDLSCNKIGIDGVEALAHVIQSTLDLNLAGNRFARSASCHDTDTSDSESDSDYFDCRDYVIRDTESEELQDHCNLMVLDLSLNICDGDPVALISKFKSLSHLDLTGNGIGLNASLAVLDYVVKSENCQKLKFLCLSSVVLSDQSLGYYLRRERTLSLRSRFEVYRAKLLHPSSSVIVDLSFNNIDKASGLSILQTLKHYDRVGGVYLEDNDVGTDKDTISELGKTFQHDSSNRVLIFNKCFRVPASNAWYMRWWCATV